MKKFLPSRIQNNFATHFVIVKFRLSSITSKCEHGRRIYTRLSIGRFDYYSALRDHETFIAVGLPLGASAN